MKMPNFSSNIEIDKNSICYKNEVLKISNISRTWIFKFQNREKRAYETAKVDYELKKRDYESFEKYKKRTEVKKYTMAGIVVGLFSIYLLYSTLWGLLGLAISISCGFIAFKKYKKEIKYDKTPPEKREFPDKYGLGIQMNSGYVAVFAAEGKKGEEALKKLQEDIKDADVHQEKTIFNMNEYNVKVEGDIDGIVNLGDDNVNINGGKELQNV